jgi:hypothetical protein
MVTVPKEDVLQPKENKQDLVIPQGVQARVNVQMIRLALHHHQTVAVAMGQGY